MSGVESEVSTKTTETDTLFVRHFPVDLTVEEREELLRHFGASRIRCFSDKGRFKYSAFATFPNHEDADTALKRLHQLKVLGSRLSVEFAQKRLQEHFPHQSDVKIVKYTHDGKDSEANRPKDMVHSKIREFTRNLNSISKQFELCYPVSPALKYRYPPPSPNIIANISNTLIMVPKFYTQVLHLMNKMNLPAPFGVVTMTSPFVTEHNMVAHQTREAKKQDVEVDSEIESELESDNEVKPSEEIPLKRTLSVKTRVRKMQRVPRSQTCGTSDVTTNSAAIDPTMVFDVTLPQIPKKIEIKLSSDVAPPMVTDPTGIVDTGFGLFEPDKQSAKEKDDDDRQTEVAEVLQHISHRELQRNRISEADFKLLPVYKNYDPGRPTTRLYLKNIAKQVEEKDLHFMYSRYVNLKDDEERNMFDIRLMKEGRMKGQAFVTLPSEKKAREALQDTNGYLLFDKPLVVQFARSAKPKGVSER